MRISSLLFGAAGVVLVSSGSMVLIQLLEPCVPDTIVLMGGAMIAVGMIAIIACSGLIIHVMRGLLEEFEEAEYGPLEEEDEE